MLDGALSVMFLRLYSILEFCCYYCIKWCSPDTLPVRRPSWHTGSKGLPCRSTTEELKEKLRVLNIQGGPAKVKPLTLLLLTVECIGKIQW